MLLQSAGDFFLHLCCLRHNNEHLSLLCCISLSAFVLILHLGALHYHSSKGHQRPQRLLNLSASPLSGLLNCLYSSPTSFEQSHYSLSLENSLPFPKDKEPIHVEKSAIHWMPYHRTAMKFLSFLAAAGHFTATSAFYPYRLPGSDSVSPVRRDAEQIPEQLSTIRIPLQKVKRSSIFKIVHSDNPSTPNSVAVAQDGFDYSYMCEIQFGANKKPMFLLVDTAAVNTWVMSSNCTTTSCTMHNTYDTPDSSSLKVSSTPLLMLTSTNSRQGFPKSILYIVRKWECKRYCWHG